MDETKQNFDAEPYDPVLQAMVAVVDKLEDRPEDDSFYITLNVGGLLISGNLIGRRQFAAEFMPGIKKRIEEENEKEEDKTLEEEENNASAPRFIHLKDAKFFIPGQLPIPTTGGTFWRGRIDSVDGYLIGELRVS